MKKIKSGTLLRTARGLLASNKEEEWITIKSGTILMFIEKEERMGGYNITCLFETRKVVISFAQKRTWETAFEIVEL